MQRRFRFRLVYTLLILLARAGFVTGHSRAAPRLAARSRAGSHALYLPLLSRSATTTPPDADNPSAAATF